MYTEYDHILWSCMRPCQRALVRNKRIAVPLQQPRYKATKLVSKRQKPPINGTLAHKHYKNLVE